MPAADALIGLTLETIYLHTVADGNSLGINYQIPVCFYNPNIPLSQQTGLGAHRCNRALFGILANGEFVDHGRLSNSDGTGGPLYPTGNPNAVPTCEDFKNIHPTWAPNTYSRYNKKVITKLESQNIVAKGSSSCFVRFTFDTALKSGQTICGGSGPHAEAAWFRVTNTNGDILYNGCFVGGATLDLYIYPLCLQMEFVEKAGPPKVYSTREVSAIPKGIFNGVSFYGVYDNQNNFKLLGYIMRVQNRWEFWEKFPITGSTRVPGGNFYGYNDDPGSPNFPIQAGTWKTNTALSPARNIKRIVSGTCGDICPIPPDDGGCDCAGKIVPPSYVASGKDPKYMDVLKKIKKEKCCPPELPDFPDSAFNSDEC